MAKGKKIKTKWKAGVCEVHWYALGDNNKRKIFFCGDCKAWLCKSCDKDVVLRMMAMVNRKIERTFKK